MALLLLKSLIGFLKNKTCKSEATSFQLLLKRSEVCRLVFLSIYFEIAYSKYKRSSEETSPTFSCGGIGVIPFLCENVKRLESFFKAGIS